MSKIPSKTGDPRHKARMVACAALFSWSFLSQDISKCQEYAELVVDNEEYDKDLANLLIRGVSTNIDTLDGFIKTVATEYPIDQMSRVDLVVLRISLFEVAIAKNVPLKVALDEGVILAKEFGGDNSGKFVNGVLGSIAKIINI
jgi:N utilization substance protein B